MYSKQEASQLKQEFWTTFGRYMTPILSAEGEKINWVNYKTGEKNVHFKMKAEAKSASIAIEVTHNDESLRQLYFEQFIQLKKLLDTSLSENWEWQQNSHDDTGRPISSISKTLDSVSIYKKDDWPALISFFKPRIIALDNFWSSARYAFELLR